MKKRAAILIAIACFFACSCSEYKSAENVAELSVSFVDPKWDGQKIPESGRCRNCGGGGFIPADSFPSSAFSSVAAAEFGVGQ